MFFVSRVSLETEQPTTVIIVTCQAPTEGQEMTEGERTHLQRKRERKKKKYREREVARSHKAAAEVCVMATKWIVS